jgi:hypothetical protein
MTDDRGREVDSNDDAGWFTARGEAVRAGRHALPELLALRVAEPAPELLARVVRGDEADTDTAPEVVIIRRYASVAQYTRPGWREQTERDMDNTFHRVVLDARLKLVSALTVQWYRVPPAAVQLLRTVPDAIIPMASVRPDTVLGSGDVLVCEVVAAARPVATPTPAEVAATSAVLFGDDDQR